MNHGWEKKTLSEVCQKESSNLMQKNIDPEQGLYPVYGANNIVGYLDYYVQPKDYIGIIKDGSGVGRVNVYPKESSLLGTLQYIIPTDNMDLHYTAYALQSKNLAKYASGAAIPHIYFKDYGKEKIGVPSLVKQKEIAEELDKINELIEVKRSQLADLDLLAQSLFYEMFGDPITNPKGWEWEEISKVANVKIGPFGSLLHKEDYIRGGTPLINPIHMQNGYVKADENFTISDNKKIELTSYLLTTNDIIFGRRGDIGRCALITSEEDGFLCGTGSLFLRFFIEINPIFSLWVLKSPSITQFLLEKAKGATMLNINCSIIASVPLILPPIELQNQFAAQIKMIEEQKKRIDSSLTDLQTLLASRMDYWFND